MKRNLVFGILLTLLTSRISAQETELLANPDFTSGTGSWWANGATVTETNGEITFDITTAGTNPWDVQLGQGNITLHQNRTYKLCWRAKRESGQLDFAVALGTAPYTAYITDNPTGFTGDWQENCIEYTHTSEDVANVAITVNMGGDNANATFDYIRLTESGGGSNDSVNVTFPVDMQNQTVSASGVFLAGSFNGWATPLPMQADNKVYAVSLKLKIGETITYKFKNGTVLEDIPWDCTVGVYGDRSLIVPDNDATLDTVCFNACTSCTGNNSNNNSNNAPSFSHPGNLPLAEVPQFVCLSFDDNIYTDGVDWLCEQVDGLKNPDNLDVGLSFYFNSQTFNFNTDLRAVVNNRLAGYDSPHEVGNHTYDHPHLNTGRTAEEWKAIIQQGMDTISHYTNLTLGSVTNSGFRAPYLETSDEMYDALQNLGVRYDHSSSSYFNENNEAVWPYRYSNNQPDNPKKYLWKVPITNLLIPDTEAELTAYGIDTDIQATVGSDRVSAGDYDLFENHKLDSASIIGLLKYNLDLSLASNKAPFTFCFHSHYYSEENASAIDNNSNTTLKQRQGIITEFIAYCRQQNEVYLTTVNRMLDWIESPASPEIAFSNPGPGPVSYYGKMQASGNRIIGERTQLPMQVKGNSFFWSIWGGQEFWNAGAVNALVDGWDTELIRAPMSADDNNIWAEEYGYIHPDGKQVQLENMERMVEAAIDRDIYVIIDFHSHHAELYTQESKEFFGYMAQKYGDYDNVIFEIYNEPIETDWPTIKAYAEDVIDTIRVHSDNLVIVGTEAYSQLVDNASLSPLDDSNVAYVFHFYAVHKEELRQRVITALNNNVALFASEWGNIHIGGEKDGLADDEAFANSDAWHALMDSTMISSANWCVFASSGTNTADLHKLDYDELSKTGENWSDTSIMTISGKYVYNLLKKQSETAPWRKAAFTNTSNVTFSVNMQNETVSDPGVFLQIINNTHDIELEMESDGMVYSATISLPIGSQVKYRYVNGTTTENATSSEACFSWDNYRTLVVPDASDYATDTSCFNACSNCPVIEVFTISTEALPEHGGSIAGGGTFDEGTEITLEASPNAGFHFTNWTKEGSVVSTEASYNITVLENATYTANFGVNPTVLTIAQVQGDTDESPYVDEFVEIQGEVTFATSSGCYIQDATSVRSSIFVRYTDFRTLTAGSGLKVTGTIYENNGQTEIKDIEYFETFSSTVDISPVDLSQAALQEDYEGMLVRAVNVEATNITTADNWYVNFENETQVLIDNKYTSLDLTANENYNLTGIVEYNNNEFKLCPRQTDDIEYLPKATYTISCGAIPAEGGTISGTGTFEEGQTALLSATPNSGYEFVNWTHNNTEMSTDLAYSFTVTEDINLTANFNQLVGINDAVSENQIRVYPNPSSEFIYIEGLPKTNNLAITIINHMGQVITEQQSNYQSKLKIDISQPGSSVYFIKINGEKTNETLKILINNAK